MNYPAASGGVLDPSYAINKREKSMNSIKLSNFLGIIVGTAFFLLCGASFQGNSAYAGVVNIDFQPLNAPLYAGTGAAPDTGTFWAEGVPGVPLSNLRFSNGTTYSGINIFTTFSNSGSYSAYNINKLVTDGLFAASTSENLTITGLVANAFYNLYAYVGYYPTMFTVDGPSWIANGTGFDSYTWQVGNQYVLLSDVQANTSGMMTLQIERSSSDLATAIAGLQIEVDTTPPSTSCSALPYTNSDISIQWNADDGSPGTPSHWCE